MSDAEKLILSFLPAGSKVLKVYQDGGFIKADVVFPGSSDTMTCTLKKNHAGQFYVE
jgi:hypothetical protein